MYGFGWRSYVPVHVRREQANRRLQALRKKGLEIEPLEVAGRQIAKTFWGARMCAMVRSVICRSRREASGPWSVDLRSTK
jgi:hypothetical protein